MNRTFALRAYRQYAVEALESRIVLDAGLGSEIAAFESEAALQAALMDKAVEQYEWLFGQEEQHFRCFDWCFPEGPIFVALDGESAAFRQGDFSDTNTQVVGVDEGDIVETDGEHIYILSANQVTIVDVRDPAHPRVASRVHLDANSHGNEMYLDGDRLLVVSNSWWYDEPFIGIGGPFVDIAFDARIGIPARGSTLATVIDVSNREAATMVSETEIDGYVSNSRAIDGTAYLVVDDSLHYPRPEFQSTTIISEDGELDREVRFYETEEQYRARVAATILDVLPSYTTHDVHEQLVDAGNVASWSETYSTLDPNYGAVVSVVTIDMHAELPTVGSGTTVMMNAGHEIFMSRENLYLFQNRWDRGDTTSIMKFEVQDEEKSVSPVASGTVPGRMLDQFSADEMNGQLRIATTTGWGDESSSGLYVLEQADDALSIKGSVDGLAPGERIFAARFVDYRGYLVTFRQVDPLFSIDLSDPENPTVEGELKIPGFSEYMQPIDQNHLLAIGRDADPRTGIADSLQLSLFDVSDINEPRLVDRYTFEGGRSTWSAAEHDHHAFSYFPDFDTLAIPVQSAGKGAWIRDEDNRRVWVEAPWGQSLHVFQVDVEQGFEFTGAISHPSEVRRSIRIIDGLYSISHDTVKANHIHDLELWGQVHYLPPANGGVVPKAPEARDIDALFLAASNNPSDARFDVDGNSLVNDDDVDFMLEAVINTHRGDANLDGRVDFEDFLILSHRFGQQGGWADGDFDGNGEVNFQDFTILSANYGKAAAS